MSKIEYFDSKCYASVDSYVSDIENRLYPKVRELEKQIENMKCCDNCGADLGDYSNCDFCTRQAGAPITGKEADKWRNSEGE